jgi:hypothetical protein
MAVKRLKLRIIKLLEKGNTAGNQKTAGQVNKTGVAPLAVKARRARAGGTEIRESKPTFQHFTHPGRLIRRTSLLGIAGHRAVTADGPGTPQRHSGTPDVRPGVKLWGLLIE